MDVLEITAVGAEVPDIAAAWQEAGGPPRSAKPRLLPPPSEPAAPRRTRLEFRLLGPVQVWCGNEEIQLAGSKQRTVLAALLLARGRVVTDAALGTLLWGEEPPRTYSAQIYTYVSRLRKSLGSDVDIARQGQGYALRAPAAWFDLDEFTALTRRGRAALETDRPDLAAAALEAALSLWRGSAVGNGTEHLADAELSALEEARLAARELRIEADLALGRAVELIAELTSLVGAHPLRERFRAQLMTALWRSHRRADALRVFFDGRNLLAEELGVDPSPLLSELYQRIISEEDPGDPRPVRPDGASRTDGGWVTALRPAMLPADLADFTGRRSSVTRLADLLAGLADTPAHPSKAPSLDSRVLSHPSWASARSEVEAEPPTPAPRQVLITGMAGVGKTALAVHVAHTCRAAFPDGQLFVDLGGSQHRPVAPADVLAWFLRALGAPADTIPADVQERAQLYRSRLAGRRILVVLDNAASDEQVRLLLPAGVGCGLLVTSIEPLAAVPIDHQLDLAVFAADEAQAFLRRMVGPLRVAEDPAAARELVDCCGRLPLALRILGMKLARKPHWPLRRMAGELRSEGTRLDQLRAGALSIRAALSRSFALVENRMLSQLRRLSELQAPVFSAVAAGRLLEMSETSAEHLLEHLVDRRLLEVADWGVGRPPLYRFHPLVHLLARELH